LCSKRSSIRLATTFSIRLEIKGRLEIIIPYPTQISEAAVALWWLVSNTTASLAQMPICQFSEWKINGSNEPSIFEPSAAYDKKGIKYSLR